MMRMPIQRLPAAALAAVLLAACADPTDPAVPETATRLASQEVLVIQTGWSGFEQPVRRVIADDAAWEAVWRTLHAHSTEVPARPAIDFGASVLLLAAMGTQPTGGYSVTITEVRAHQGTLYATVVERSPGPSCGTFQALTSPVHIVQVPRQGTVAQFTVQRETYHCP
jgi:hypothetical protein